MDIKFDRATKICPACPNRMDPITSHVIPEEIGKIEVVKGPYTVRFGRTFLEVWSIWSLTTYIKNGITWKCTSRL